MHPQKAPYIPWRERAFVAIPEAAEIVARSPEWIRDRIGEGRLTARRMTEGGPMLVTVESLLAIIDGAVPVAEPSRSRKPRCPKAPPRTGGHLRLIVNNP